MFLFYFVLFLFVSCIYSLLDCSLIDVTWNKQKTFNKINFEQ